MSSDHTIHVRLVSSETQIVPPIHRIIPDKPIQVQPTPFLNGVPVQESSLTGAVESEAVKKHTRRSFRNGSRFFPARVAGSEAIAPARFGGREKIFRARFCDPTRPKGTRLGPPFGHAFGAPSPRCRAALRSVSAVCGACSVAKATMFSRVRSGRTGARVQPAFSRSSRPFKRPSRRSRPGVRGGPEGRLPPSCKRPRRD